MGVTAVAHHLSCPHINTNTLYHPCRLSAFLGLRGVCSVCLSAGVPLTVPLSRRMTRQRQEKVGGEKNHLASVGRLIDQRGLCLGRVKTLNSLSVYSRHVWADSCQYNLEVGNSLSQLAV